MSYREVKDLRKSGQLDEALEMANADLEKDNLMGLPRYDCNDFPPKSENYKN